MAKRSGFARRCGFGRVDQVARRQYGLITLRQLVEAGVPAHAVRALTGTGRMVRVRRGVYRLCGAPLSWRSTVLAAVLSIGGQCVLSHRSAGVLWGLLEYGERSDGAGGAIEVTTPSSHRVPGVRVHRCRLVARTTHLGIPVTTVERTILDLAQTAGAEEIGRYMDDALRRRLTTLGRLSTEARRIAHRGRRRIRPFLDALRDRGVGYDPGANEWEKRMDSSWDAMGLPPARRQYRVRVGGRQYRIDRAIVAEKIAVEWNGHYPHGERSRFDYDSDRRARLIAAGWLPLDFTSRSSPELIRSTVLSAYEQRRRDRDIRAVG